MNTYLDDHVVEGFRIAVIETLTENIQFAMQADIDSLDMGEEAAEEDFRQTAQDVTEELMAPVLDAVGTAYRRAIGSVDDAAIAIVFERLAIQAKINELLADPKPPRATVFTRNNLETTGTLRSRAEHDGQDCLWVTIAHNGTEDFIPIRTIRAIVSNRRA